MISFKTKFPFRHAAAISLIVTLGLPSFGQEKAPRENASSLFVAQHDLGKYSSDATKWEPDVDKLSATNMSDGAEDAIVCLGSSSFRLWNTIDKDMAPYKIVRRAYGGAKYCDLAIHAPKLVDGLRFRAAMIFVGNDITGNEKDKSPEEIARLAKIVMDTVREQHPDAPVFLIAITPTPSRFQHWSKIVMANRALEKLASEQPNTFFVSTQDKYLNSQGEPRPELFEKDRLHQNQEGYLIWSSLLKRSLGSNQKSPT